MTSRTALGAGDGADGEHYVVGVDIGGTFTDWVCTDGRGQTVIGKAPTTPPTFEAGFLDALAVVAGKLGLGTEAFLQRTGAIYHGCTVGTNALVEGRTARVGLLASAGHGESLALMQAGGRLHNMPAEYVARVAGHDKPDPLVPMDLVREVPERVLQSGQVLVGLQDEAAREAVHSLSEDGVEAFAVCLLWSVVNPVHERRIGQLIEEIAPSAYVSLSSDVSPKVGEYERAVGTVMNALVGPVMQRYLGRLAEALRTNGFVGSFEVMSCSGGLVSEAEARSKPILTIGSGPVAGLIGARQLAGVIRQRTASTGAPNLLTLDIGGTTADIGVMPAGEPLLRSSNWHGQYEYFVSRLDVRSIGVGGGSIVRYDAARKTLRVGPQSAGADPGPVAYGKGGLQATVCDANLVLGFLNPHYFLGGSITLDVGAAEEALAIAGEPLGFSAIETAAAVARIGDSHMADAIRLASIGEGVDPRTFVLCAYGGAGAVHAAAVARELGIGTVIVPLSDLAAGWSAFGVARSNALAIEESPMGLRAPFEMTDLQRAWEALASAALQRMHHRGVAEAELRYQATLKYELQTHELTVTLPACPAGELASEELVDLFGREYERLYGEGTGYAAAGVQLTSLAVTARSPDRTWGDEPTELGSGEQAPTKGTRGVVWYELGTTPVPTPVIEGSALRSSMRFDGPAVVELPNTTIAVRPGQVAQVDGGGNVIVRMQPMESLP